MKKFTSCALALTTLLPLVNLLVANSQIQVQPVDPVLGEAHYANWRWVSPKGINQVFAKYYAPGTRICYRRYNYSNVWIDAVVVGCDDRYDFTLSAEAFNKLFGQLDSRSALIAVKVISISPRPLPHYQYVSPRTISPSGGSS